MQLDAIIWFEAAPNRKPAFVHDCGGIGAFWDAATVEDRMLFINKYRAELLKALAEPPADALDIPEILKRAPETKH
jgi:hypothetical protein